MPPPTKRNAQDAEQDADQEDEEEEEEDDRSDGELSAKEQELSDLSDAKGLKGCNSSTIKERLRNLGDMLYQLNECDAADSGAISKRRILRIFRDNGFCGEIVRTPYIGKDTDPATQILAARVLVEGCGLTAPDFPFDASKRKQVMQCLLRQFKHLEMEKAAADGETYRLVFAILDGIVATELFSAVLTDDTLPGSDELLAEVFDAAINKLKDRTTDDTALRGKLEDLLLGILKSMSQVPQALLDIFLAPLASQKKSEGSTRSSRTLVRNVIRRLNQSMLNAISEHLVSKLEQTEKPLSAKGNEPTVVAGVINKIRRIFNTMMNVSEGHGALNSAFLPRISSRQHHEEKALRLLATDAMCRAFNMHTTHFTEYQLLFQQTLKQFHDTEKEVRLHMVEWYEGFVESRRESLIGDNNELGPDLAECLLDPLIDPDASVRVAALEAVTSIVQLPGGAHLLPLSVVKAAFTRMRDKKPTVRSVAVKRFGKVFQEMMEKQDQVKAPFNQIPRHMLESYSCKLAKPDQRTQVEQALIRFILPEDDDEDEEPSQHNPAEVGKLAFSMIKTWNSLPEEAQDLFAKLVISKKQLREVAHVLPAVVLRTKRYKLDDTKLTQNKDLDPATRNDELRKRRADPERVKIVLLFQKIVAQLNASCRLAEDGGLELLLYVPGQDILKNVVGQIAKIFENPSEGMALKKSIVSELKKALPKALPKIEKDEIRERVKRLPIIIESLLTRLCFPVSTSLIRSVGAHARSGYENADGTKAVQLSHLHMVLAQSFPDMFLHSSDAVSDLANVVLMIADDEAAAKSWGGEATADDPLVPRADSSPAKGKKKKTMSLAQRRQALFNALKSLHFLASHNTAVQPAVADLTSAPAVPPLLEQLPKQVLTKLLKSLNKLALYSTEKITKVTVKLIAALSSKDLQTRAEALKKLVDEGAKLLDSKKPATYLSVSVMRVLQQAILLHPHTNTALLSPGHKFAAVVLPALAKEQVKFTKHHSFEAPPVACCVFRMCLKYITTYLAVLHRIETHDIVKETTQICNKLVLGLAPHTLDGTPNLAKGIQTMDIIKAMLRLGRYRGTREVFFSNQQPQNWQRVMVLMLENRVECRSEIGRVLHRDLIKGHLWLGFAQLLVVTLSDSNKQNYVLAGQRLGELIATYRDKQAKNNIMLDTPHAPAFCPEYIVPQLLHLLSRFPNLEDQAPSYLPVQHVLFGFFEKLLQKPQCFDFLKEMVLRIRKLDDAANPESTDTRLIADIALMVLNTVANKKSVQHNNYPGVIRIPALFKEASPEHDDWITRVFIDEKKFVPITFKEAGKANPLDLDEDGGAGSPKRSPRSPRSPKKGSGSATPAGRQAGSPATTGKRKLASVSGGASSSKPASKRATSEASSKASAKKPAAKAGAKKPAPKDTKKRTASTTPSTVASKRSRK